MRQLLCAGMAVKNSEFNIREDLPGTVEFFEHSVSSNWLPIMLQIAGTIFFRGIPRPGKVIFLDEYSRIRKCRDKLAGLCFCYQSAAMVEMQMGLDAMSSLFWL